MSFLFLLLIVCFAYGITEEEFRKDREYIRTVDERLSELDRKAKEGIFSLQMIEEINSYGYPIYKLKRKYSGRRNYEKFYRKIVDVYEKVLFVKRKLFPYVVKRELKELGIPVCKIEVRGKKREVLVIGLRNLSDERTVERVMTETQLQNAYLLGIESLNFEKCR